jgi:hypothetical protein
VAVVRFLVHVVGFSACMVRFQVAEVRFLSGVVDFPVCIIRFSMDAVRMILCGSLVVTTAFIALVNGMVPLSFGRGISDVFGTGISNFLGSGVMGAFIMMKRSMKIAADIRLIITVGLLSIVAFIMLKTLVNVVSIATPLVLLQLLKLRRGASMGALSHRRPRGLDVGNRIILKRSSRWLELNSVKELTST